MQEPEQNRRPIQSRSSNWAQKVAAYLVKTNISPNQISVISILFAYAGAYCLLKIPNYFGLICCVFGIQGRLICNLLDGMVAIEGGKKSPLGVVYNEFPDRIADSILIVALGYSANIPELGWFGALMAALTAYVRVFGGSLGFPQNFGGPMAKQHRMAVMTVGCLIGAIELKFNGSKYSLLVAIVLIALGSTITCMTRTRAIANHLRNVK